MKESVIQSGGMTNSLNPIYRASIYYCCLPLLIFLATYLKWYFALIGTSALAIAVMLHFSKEKAAIEHKLALTKRQMFGLALASLAWTYLGGMNGYFYQAEDWAYRNAIYADLIRFDWPIIYPENQTALVYYVGHWLPPAALAKLVLFVTGSFESAFYTGRFFLWFWSSLGVWMMLVLFCSCLNVASGKTCILAATLLIFFSGMDIIGVIICHRAEELFSYPVMHMEGWYKYQFTSVTACLFWVFNQSIIPWILTCCFLLTEDVSSFVLYICACLISGPFPAVGLAMCMTLKLMEQLFVASRENRLRSYCKTIFSTENLISGLCILPILLLYLGANDAVKNGPELLPESVISGGKSVLLEKIAGLLFFLLLEVGLYMLLIWEDHRKNPQFYGIAISFVAAPCIHVGYSNDFCMRATIPALMILCVYCGRFLLEHLAGGRQWKKKLFALCLVLCLMVGAVTPLMEFLRGFCHVISEGTFKLENMSVGTLSTADHISNFCCSDYHCHAFFRYLAR